mmetsp:Transcript_7991/g.19422  ORF Transcript_7991/g.19422 Transcript_7991/m.19422 type:complete len:277 (-) Transcript_7991:89-919(-)
MPRTLRTAGQERYMMRYATMMLFHLHLVLVLHLLLRELLLVKAGLVLPDVVGLRGELEQALSQLIELGQCVARLGPFAGRRRRLLLLLLLIVTEQRHGRGPFAPTVGARDDLLGVAGADRVDWRRLCRDLGLALLLPLVEVLVEQRVERRDRGIAITSRRVVSSTGPRLFAPPFALGRDLLEPVHQGLVRHWLEPERREELLVFEVRDHLLRAAVHLAVLRVVRVELREGGLDDHRHQRLARLGAPKKAAGHRGALAGGVAASGVSLAPRPFLHLA